MSFPNTPVVPEFPVIYLNDKPITYDSNLEVIPKSPQPVETISRKPVAWVDLFPEQADELLAWQIIVGHKDAPLMSEIDFSECPSESLDDDDEFDSSFDSQKREGDGRSYFSDDSDDDEEETSIISIVPQTALEEVTLTRSEDDIARENQRLILLLEDYIKDLGIKNQRPKSFQFGPRSKFLKAKL
ncbi:hypothetical protein CC1G_02610 [Coprinopsis cinerea okayama7|uniref:Uncharacterized protein n=1 Tax=Coprinopsis cinerea (strain Okayama-7 / 130 / ATCC MYA-4618 / FGSC 9003) TaxID=240176 RepID=A8PBC2_COPC7|nr:hypothetical protein CC1G_02610 [Coprinopsis cinerea okayama7\|eukprot:XP_001840147.1 hypothetical protein CC1G_02610 [Coprinopsis cinerea okayama7\